MFHKVLKWFMAFVFVWMILTPVIAAANGNDAVYSVAIRSACDKGLVVMAPSMVRTFKAPPESVTVPLFVATEKRKSHVHRIRLQFLDVEETVYIEEDLEPVRFPTY